MLSLDGSTLEGGGQLVRVALSLSAICDIPITIHSIRANRARKGKGYQSSGQQKGQNRSRNDDSKSSSRSNHSKQLGKPESTAGGLKESHLAALKWLAEQCEAEVEGDKVGSTEITFIPRAKVGRKHRNGTAKQLTNEAKTSTITLNGPGSVWLIFQALYPYLVFEQHQFLNESFTLHIHGGTHVPKSMSTHYLTQVFQPMGELIGLPPFTIKTHQYGWAGASPTIGHVEIIIPVSGGISALVGSNDDEGVKAGTPFKLSPFELNQRGKINKITAHILASPESTRTIIHETLSQLIPQHLPGIPLDLAHDSPSSSSSSSEDSEDPRHLYILLVAHTSTGIRLGRDVLGGGRNPKNAAEARRIAEVACENVVRDLKREVLGKDRCGVCCVDEFMQDQLVVFQALARGRSVVGSEIEQVDEDGNGTITVEEIVSRLNVRDEEEEDVVSEDTADEGGDNGGSLHTRTVRWVAENMLRAKYLSKSNRKHEKQNVQFSAGGVCEGIGWNSSV